MKKAGIFDPWRQAAAPPLDETPARKTPTETEIDETVTPLCIQFNGLRAGIYVWLPVDEDGAGLRARLAIMDLLLRIAPMDGVSKILSSWGITVGCIKNPDLFWEDKGKTISFVSDVHDDRLVLRIIDNLSLALREISQHDPHVRDMLEARKIKPYGK